MIRNSAKARQFTGRICNNNSPGLSCVSQIRNEEVEFTLVLEHRTEVVVAKENAQLPLPNLSRAHMQHHITCHEGDQSMNKCMGFLQLCLGQS